MPRSACKARLFGLMLPVALVTALGQGCAEARPLHKAPVHAHLAPPRFAPASATTAFGLDLMRALGDGNLVFSPDSIATALSMAGTGAAGNTASQMALALRLHSPSLFSGVGDLQRRIAAEQAASAGGDPEAPTLELADTLFLQRGEQIGAPFLNRLAEHFGATPQLVDFEHAGAEAVQSINDWVAEHTHGLIAKLLDRLPVSTRLVLANAIYLKAAWAEQFKTGETYPAKFHSPGNALTTQFMHETAGLDYASGRGYAAISLPYRSSTLSLLVLLPVGQSVEHMLRGLEPSKLSAIVGAMKPRIVRVSLPRFHIALKASLNGALQALGMTDAFKEGAADFSGIGAHERLKIGLVQHAADFKIDESGTLAAAATAVTIEATSAPAPVPRTVAFNANRPFLFFLRDDRTGALLFAGRLVNPSGSE